MLAPALSLALLLPRAGGGLARAEIVPIRGKSLSLRDDSSLPIDLEARHVSFRSSSHRSRRVDPNLLSLDVYGGTVPNAPFMVYVHGGGWMSGAARRPRERDMVYHFAATGTRDRTTEKLGLTLNDWIDLDEVEARGWSRFRAE